MKYVSKPISDLQGEEYQLCQTSQDCKEMLAYCGITNVKVRNRSAIDNIEHIDHLLIKEKDGEILEMWAISGIPWLYKPAYLVYFQM